MLTFILIVVVVFFVFFFSYYSFGLFKVKSAFSVKASFFKLLNHMKVHFCSYKEELNWYADSFVLNNQNFGVNLNEKRC